MANIDELEKAIGAHGAWKIRLRMAIESGKVDAQLEEIGTDDHCEFGRWLHGPTLTETDRLSPHYAKVLALHAEFHRTAACVAGLAVTGRRSEAEILMSLRGDYTAVSTKLTLAMIDWKKATHARHAHEAHLAFTHAPFH